MSKRTPLFQKHVDSGGKMVDFAGWEMPINYGSQVAEHKQVREHAGVFDVSHMTIVDVSGADALAFLPQVGRIGSLNVAMATTIALWEVRRDDWTSD